MVSQKNSIIAMISEQKIKSCTNTKAIAIRPDFAEAWYSRENALDLGTDAGSDRLVR